MRIKHIANPVSGGDARLRIQIALVALRQQGIDVDLSLTDARVNAWGGLPVWFEAVPRAVTMILPPLSQAVAKGV
ncbi:MAG: hypothetical protein ACSLFH_14750 [Desulfuromonadales bacterium]